MINATFKIWRGDANAGEFREYSTEISEGMVVLDAVHDIQARQANDGSMQIRLEPLPEMPDYLKQVIEEMK